MGRELVGLHGGPGLGPGRQVEAGPNGGDRGELRVRGVEGEGERGDEEAMARGAEEDERGFGGGSGKEVAVDASRGS